MPLERHFLGWDGPALPRAAAWLCDRYAHARELDLSRVVIVTPTSRAARRMLDWLVHEARTRHLLLTPPRIETLGRLPELLYEAGRNVADDLQAMLARTESLRAADPETLAHLFPRPPEKEDAVGWWNLAAMLHALAEDLAAARLTVADIPVQAQALGLDLRRESHFDLLAQLEASYHRTLSDAGLCDQQAARLDALANHRCRCDTDIILVAAADLSPLTAAMLRAAGEGSGAGEGDEGREGREGREGGHEGGGVIAALVHAPSDHAPGFDDLGGFDVAYWSNRPIDLADDALHFVDRPADQARAALSVLPHAAPEERSDEGAGISQRSDEGAGIPHAAPEERSDEGAGISHAAPERSEGAGNSSLLTPHPSPITIGLGDQTLAGTVKRALEMAGIPARFGPGRRFLRSRPALALAALARFAAQYRFDDFAQLLRHPDIEACLHKASSHHARSNDFAVVHWITLLDDYARDHLQGRVDGRWLGDEREQALLKALWRRVMRLLPDDAAQVHPLNHWAAPILDALRRVYGDIELIPANPADQRLITALETLAQVLRDQAALDPAAPTTPRLTFSQAIDLTLARLSDAAIPEEAGDPAVELMGYLELQLDDAPQLIITSMNEGSIPASRHDAGLAGLLPDHVRRALGLTDNARRAARDRMMLQAIVSSRPSVTLIAGRYSLQGDPLTPSRLLLACDEKTMARRIRHFYRDQATSHAAPERSEGAGSAAPGAADAFLIPAPDPDAPILDHLPVTAFRAYIACPYRFYLQYVCRLQGIDDQAVELDASAFGSLAHQVLEAFGQSDLRDSNQPDDIAAFLSHTLDHAAAVRYGDGVSWRPAMRIQIEQLRQRFEAFAAQQARWVDEGWRIVETDVEQSIQGVLQVDGEPFTITGRIDRVDRHPDHGYRILDYKTGDRGDAPDKTHRKRIGGEKQWVDLQLPLYRVLCAQPPFNIAGPVELGYINLPKKLGDVRLELADWTDDELTSARDLACDIIRAIRHRIFWEPADPPAWPDDFSGICADQAMDRRALIERSNQTLTTGV